MKYNYISTLKSSDRGDIQLVENSSGKRFVRRYREISEELFRRISGIDCPYIEELTERSADEDGSFFVSEYINGIPACDREFTRQEAVSALKELCMALEALHAVGVIHRDIKLSNIICGSDGHIRLIDFDSARIFREYRSRDTKPLGTEGYAAPEQYGFMQTDCRSDIYSFGVTMRELLGKNADEPRFRRIIARCTAFDPEKRYGNISSVHRVLKRAERPYLIPCCICAAVIAAAACTAVLLSNRPEPIFESADEISSVSEDISAVSDVPAEFSFTTERGGNGMYRDVFDYVFIDDPQVHGKWTLSGVFSDDTDFSALTADDVITTSPYIEMFVWRSYEFLPDGTYTLYGTDNETLSDGRWTSGYYINQDSGYEFVQEMFVLTLDDGNEYLFLEQKPTGNYRNEPLHRYLMFTRV